MFFRVDAYAVALVANSLLRIDQASLRFMVICLVNILSFYTKSYILSILNKVKKLI